MMITDTSSAEAAMNAIFNRSNAIVAITLGSQGTLLGNKDKMQIVPSIPITPVDTTGAGDAFVGAVLFQLSQYAIKDIRQLDESNWITIFSKGNIAGAKTCEYMGAMEAFKYLNGNTI